MPGESRYYDEIDLGDELPTIERTIEWDQVNSFVQVSRGGGDGRFTDPERAKALGLPGPIVPGGLLMGLLGKMIADWAPNARVHKLDVVFRGNVAHQQPITMAGIVVEMEERDGENILEVDVYIQNDKGDRAANGKATISLPNR